MAFEMNFNVCLVTQIQIFILEMQLRNPYDREAEIDAHEFYISTCCTLFRGRLTEQKISNCPWMKNDQNELTKSKPND